jgi:hypothetical protein
VRPAVAGEGAYSNGAIYSNMGADPLYSNVAEVRCVFVELKLKPFSKKFVTKYNICAAWGLQRSSGDSRGREAGGETGRAGHQGLGQCPALRHPASGRHKAAPAHFRGELLNL